MGERRRLAEAFAVTDTDGDGVLSVSELEEFCRKFGKGNVPPPNVVGSGEVRLDRFCSVVEWLERKSGVSCENIVTACIDSCYLDLFRVVDADHSGTISHTELRQLVDMMQLRLTDDDIRRIFREADTDTSGQIDADEFVTITKRIAPHLSVSEMNQRVRAAVEARRNRFRNLWSVGAKKRGVTLPPSDPAPPPQAEAVRRAASGNPNQARRTNSVVGQGSPAEPKTPAAVEPKTPAAYTEPAADRRSSCGSRRSSSYGGIEMRATMRSQAVDAAQAALQATMRSRAGDAADTSIPFRASPSAGLNATLRTAPADKSLPPQTPLKAPRDEIMTPATAAPGPTFRMSRRWDGGFKASDPSATASQTVGTPATLPPAGGFGEVKDHDAAGPPAAQEQGPHVCPKCPRLESELQTLREEALQAENVCEDLQRQLETERESRRTAEQESWALRTALQLRGADLARVTDVAQAFSDRVQLIQPELAAEFCSALAQAQEQSVEAEQSTFGDSAAVVLERTAAARTAADAAATAGAAATDARAVAYRARKQKGRKNVVVAGGSPSRVPPPGPTAQQSIVSVTSVISDDSNPPGGAAVPRQTRPAPRAFFASRSAAQAQSAPQPFAALSPSPGNMQIAELRAAVAGRDRQLEELKRRLHEAQQALLAGVERTPRAPPFSPGSDLPPPHPSPSPSRAPSRSPSARSPSWSREREDRSNLASEELRKLVAAIHSPTLQPPAATTVHAPTSPHPRRAVSPARPAFAVDLRRRSRTPTPVPTPF
eukprot:Hpha_TRINITY_DN30552_c0_g1::TRINITY_DN30552_c0_g1_i1::g.193709::m.193709